MRPVGRSKSRWRHSWPIGPTLNEIVGGFAISDAAAAITASLDQLNDPNIDAITISDNGQVAPSVQQLTTDATAIGKLQSAGPGACAARDLG